MIDLVIPEKVGETPDDCALVAHHFGMLWVPPVLSQVLFIKASILQGIVCKELINIEKGTLLKVRLCKMATTYDCLLLFQINCWEEILFLGCRVFGS